jgi:hypothetical protein
MRGTTTIEIAGAPPSLNKLGARGRPVDFHRTKKRWQGTLEGYLTAATYSGRQHERLPRPIKWARITATIEFPTNRRRDEGNFRSLLEKALGDALTNGGWLADDTGDSYRFQRLDLKHNPRKGKATTIQIEWEA